MSKYSHESFANSYSQMFVWGHHKCHWSHFKYTAMSNKGYYVAVRMYFFALFSETSCISSFGLAFLQKLCRVTILTTLMFVVSFSLSFLYWNARFVYLLSLSTANWILSSDNPGCNLAKIICTKWSEIPGEVRSASSKAFLNSSITSAIEELLALTDCWVAKSWWRWGGDVMASLLLIPLWLYLRCN